MDSQHVKGSETQAKCARHYFCHVSWSLSKITSSKNSVFLVSEILKLFLKKLTPNDKYLQMEKKNWIFFSISEIYIKFLILSKKRWPLEVIWFWNYRLQIAGLLKSLKSPVSEHLWRVNMLKGPKHYLNRHGSFFAIFLDPSKRKSARKSMS